MKPNNDNTSKGTGDAQEQEESSSRRLKCSIKAEAFCCDVCSKPLRPPIFQCHEGHFFCSRCANDELLEKKCILSSGCTGTIMRSHGMDNAVQSISVDCTHAERGCTEKILYSDSYNHELFCPHAPCRCPEPSCGFAGTAAELLDHLTTHHKWPSVMFQYWVPFDLRIVKPGTHVLQSKNDGQLFLLNVQSTEPPGLIVSLDCVQYFKSTDCGCSVSFSCSTGHRSTSTLDCVWPCCCVCSQPLRPPIFEKPAYCDKIEHEKACKNAPYFCPEAGCGFVGLREELLDHLTGVHHGWPSTAFHYRGAFDLRVVQPGVHVLHAMDDGQLFLVNARRAAAPPGLAVSLVCVPPCLKPTGFGCTVSFSCFRRHRSTTTVDELRPLQLSEWPPADCICVLPRASPDGPDDDAGVALTITIVCAEADDKYDDIEEASDTESDEDDS
ncbi:hypothetical protein HU200_002012 [Digitaria exilis]|uniref:RING-type E3 ubiquitin transferase n=1 Tax=Digitaria exilis TaxID=1010633 RepID=A0A835G0B0_9POAL|nr:hypothetical protein HU200_002012 [Digitaria exilis]